MAKFQWSGEFTVVLPTLGLTLSEGDVFDAPDDFFLPGFISASAPSKKLADPAPVDAPVEDGK